jgi:hypothetical protein
VSRLGGDLEREVRRVLVDLADEGRPVPLGRRALDRVRRRRERRTRALTAAAAVALVALAVPRLLGADGGPPEPTPDLTGRTVLAAYATADDRRVLNPVTGGYRRTDLAVESVAPDLRYAAGTRLAGYPASFPAEEPRLGVLDVRTGTLDWYRMADQVAAPVWSPDGRHVVARLGEPGSRRAVMVTPAEAAESVVDLEVSADRLVLSLCWADVNKLLAVTVPQPGSRSAATELVVLDREGRRERTVPVSADWTVTCAGRDGRVLLSRLAEQRGAAVVPPEVAVVDLTTGRVSAPVRLPWAGTIQPTVWRTDRSFLAVSQDRVLTVDLTTATVTEAPQAPDATKYSAYAIFVPADGLARYAAEVFDVTF